MLRKGYASTSPSGWVKVTGEGTGVALVGSGVNVIGVMVPGNAV